MSKNETTKLSENDMAQVKGGRVFPKIDIDTLSINGAGSSTSGGGGAGKVKFDRLSIKK